MNPPFNTIGAWLATIAILLIVVFWAIGKLPVLLAGILLLLGLSRVL